MKRFVTLSLGLLAVALVLVLTTVIVVGCSSGKPPQESSAGKTDRPEAPQEIAKPQAATADQRASNPPPFVSDLSPLVTNAPTTAGSGTDAENSGTFLGRIPGAAPNTGLSITAGTLEKSGANIAGQTSGPNVAEELVRQEAIDKLIQSGQGGNNRGPSSGQSLGTRSIGGAGGGGFGGGGRRGGGGGTPPSATPGLGELSRQRANAREIRTNLPLLTEELWIIAKTTVLAAPDDNAPRSGALLAKIANKPEQVPVPLKHTDVKARIDGYIATVDVTQQYHNPFSEKIEAVYVFPLPQNAAINEFVMTIGERKIRGIIRERQEAQQIYNEARQQGYVASLLTQERPNIFTQSVANIEPGKEIDIDIKYFHTLEYVDGWYEWTFPMVVGPRFNPPYSTDGIGAVGLGARSASGQSTEIQYLRPEQRSGHDISLSVQVNAGVKIEEIKSTNHRVSSESPELGFATVQLDPSDSIPNKDFVLRYRVAGETLKSAVMVQRNARGDGGYFTLMLVPPQSINQLPRQPLEMVFTLDVSGSMSGQPIAQARAAIRYALTHMRPDDTFQVVLFDSVTRMMSERSLPATPENLAMALKHIELTNASGGTMMLEGIRKSLNFPRDEANRPRVVAFLTDGYIGNEADILREVHASLRDSRIFSFGVGSSPNRYLLDGMAKMGAGAAAYLSLNDNAESVMSAYFDRISHPALTDIAVDFGGSMKVTDVYPQKTPDLFVGRPIVITGQFTGKGPTTVHVKGKFAGEIRQFDIPINLDAAESQHRGIASVWARMKIAALADQSTWDDSADFTTSIRQVALDFDLMSQFTSFIAVDSSTRTAGDHGTTLAVPVPVPDGVRYDTTVQER
jgi:Ca-activated chloride channel family protein